jgi:hypothetical protein
MNDETKYVLAWLIPSVILVLGVLFLCLNYVYIIQSKFIEGGYHQEQQIGSCGIIWKK